LSPRRNTKNERVGVAERIKATMRTEGGHSYFASILLIPFLNEWKQLKCTSSCGYAAARRDSDRNNVKVNWLRDTNMKSVKCI
jgi:hypothetical protein